MPILNLLPDGKAFALAITVTLLVAILNLLPVTIAVAFALAVALPRATSKPLPVTAVSYTHLTLPTKA